jgi:hypothetical protein
MKLDTVSITPPLPWVNSRIVTDHKRDAPMMGRKPRLFGAKISEPNAQPVCSHVPPVGWAPALSWHILGTLGTPEQSP